MDERALFACVREILGPETRLDDCAVIPVDGRYLVVSTDMLHEKTDFPPGMTERQIGWMSVAVTLSDIASMGAAPDAILVAVGLDDWTRFTEIMEGVAACCRRYGAELVGGDIDRHDELTIVSTGLGSVSREHLVLRSGASPGDLVCVTGTLGQAQAALEGFSRYETALFEPVPRVIEGQILGGAGVTAMIDVSDGLALSLYDMREAGGCGFEISAARIPMPDDIPEDRALEYAVYGGGDFELLFTCPPDRPTIDGVEYSIIGTVIEDPTVRLDGAVIEPEGFQHRWEDRS